MRGGLLAMLVAGGILSSSALCQAQCTKDTDCKGDRVCDAGQCTMPAEPPARSRETEPDPEPADIEAAPPKASAEAPPADVHFFAEDESEKPRKVKKRLTSPGMMVGGIILASSGPIFLAVGVLTTHCPHQSTDSCDAGPRLLAFGLGAAALIGVGVPLIVMGAKRVPVRQVAIAPWVSPRDAGLAMQLQF